MSKMETENEWVANDRNAASDQLSSGRLKLKTYRKGFREYMFEGIMIFLAVSMGFIADNIRESNSERKQARLYAISMINDLESDTLDLTTYINYMSYAASNIDTLLSLVSEGEIDQIESGKLYWYGLWGGAFRPFVPNDATFQQMKSSGTLRFFSNSLLQKVVKYDELSRRMIKEEDNDNNLYLEVRKSRARIFEFKYNMMANRIYQESRQLPIQGKIDSFIHSNPPLLTEDKGVFNEYLELVRSRHVKQKAQIAKLFKDDATLILSELKNEFQLE